MLIVFLLLNAEGALGGGSLPTNMPSLQHEPFPVVACHYRIRYRVRQIRELMAVWEAWQRFNQEPEFELPAWEEADVFSNVLPWMAASPAQSTTEQHARYKVICAVEAMT